MKVRLPRGLRDLEPEMYDKVRFLYEKFLKVAEKYGFKIMEPSTIELFETVCMKSGPQIRDEIYVFKDKSGRELALRFDLTVGLTRYVISNPQLPTPSKLAAFSMMWRYDEPQFARYRCFYQWDVEIYGANQILAGAEVIAFSSDYLFELGLRNFEIRLSSRAFMNKLIENFFPGADSLELMRIIDKRDKIGSETMLKMLKEKVKEKEKIPEFIDIILRQYDAKNLEEEIPPTIRRKTEEEIRELVETTNLAKELGARNLRIDLSIVRGLDYYDSVVFEIICKDFPETGAIAGGGGFTALVKAFGGNFNAFGAAGGIERTIIVMDRLGLFPKRSERQGYFVAVVDVGNLEYALDVVRQIRNVGIKCDFDITGRKLERQLKYAEKMGFKKVLIIGKKEMTGKTVTIKDFETGKQATVPLKEFLEKITKESPNL